MFELKLRAKPIVKWAGGKSGTLPQLVSVFPNEFKRYLEPFVGGGAVFLSLKQNVPAILNDANEDLIELLGVVRDRPLALMTACDALAEKYGEKFYYKFRARTAKNRVDRAARMLFLNKTCFNGLYRINAKGEFNVPFGRYVRCPTIYDRENLLAVSARLKNALLMSCDFEGVVNLAKRGDLVYCDPPYDPLSRTSSFQGYTTQGFSREQQVRLKEACQRAVQRGATVVVSSSNSKAMVGLYEGYGITKFMARRKINSKGNLRGAVPEILVTMSPKRRPKNTVPEKDNRQALLPL